MKARTPQTRKGFTLIELLVVIAIIALLAAILFPVFAKAREKARQTTCLSNMKQVGLAVIQYNQDYDETFINGIVYNGSVWVGWAGLLYPELKNPDILHCPDDPTALNTPIVAGGIVVNNSNKSYRYPVSYALNSNLMGEQNKNNTGGAPHFVDVPLSAIAAPASTVLAFEVHGAFAEVTKLDEGYSVSAGAPFSAVGTGLSIYNGPPSPVTGQNKRGLAAGNSNAGSITYATGYISNRPNGYYPGAMPVLNGLPTDMDSPVHSGGSNFLATDGHAKWLPASYVSAGGWATQPTNAQDQACPFPGTYPCAAGTSNLTGGSKFVLTFSPN